MTFKFTTETTAIFYNLKQLPIQQMLDFDYLCERNPSVSAIVHPGKKGTHKAFFGQQEILIPIYDYLTEATKKHPQAEVLINFASHRSAYHAAKEALGISTLKTIVIVAEGIPERQTKELIALAKKEPQNLKLLIGPSTVGGIAAGSFRIAGYAGGKIENVIRAKLYRPGSVGLVSKSGGMMNELFNILARTTDGAKEGIAIGGDLFPGSTLLDNLLRFQADPQIKLLVALGELGGKQEYDIIKAKRDGKITKPLIMWVPGTCANIFPWEVQFGHAGAKAGSTEESAQAKNQALKEAGIIVPASFEQLEETIAQTFATLSLPKKEERVPKNVPLDYNEALKEKLVRKATNITTTISSDLGEEPTYGAIPISKVIEENYSLGNLLALLWFKKKLPNYFTQFLEKCIILTADHGPAVAGAHNAIVAARAGKDIISSLCSGLLTIGPRFGGAIDDAGRYFRNAVESNLAPAAFIEEMKQKGIPIPGIGHRVKSIRNPDKRVELLKEFARKNFPSTKNLEYALQVEKITTKKAENLILNVDGCIAALFLDALESSQEFSDEETKEIIEIGYMNGLFALSRSIGIIGHILDQKRLKEGLYRHPTEDILYLNDKEV
ncbi:MAG TPA: citrate/2-methylcitrate synthase [Candidatus Nanoarchaeia archaeon]|nr:citrate/2-methylcitrate synthase [Candidatus Nanoarchaeia archaeon]